MDVFFNDSKVSKLYDRWVYILPFKKQYKDTSQDYDLLQD